MQVQRILGIIGVMGIAWAAHGQKIFDSFDDGVLDSSTWLAAYPRANSDLIEGNDVLTFVNQGTITAQGTFPTAVISGRIRFTGSAADSFNMYVRSDGELGGTFNAPLNGITLGIRPSDFPGAVEIGLALNREGFFTTTLQEASTTARIEMNEWVEFILEDDGTTITAYVGDLQTPVMVVDADYDYGDLVLLKNRDRQATDTVVEMDWVEILGPEPVGPPVPVLTANGQQGFAFLRQGELLTLTVNLEGSPSLEAEGWVLALMPRSFQNNLFHLDASAGFVGEWVPWAQSRFAPSFTGPVPELESVNLLQASFLPPGLYVFYFGYDTIPNGRIDFQELAGEGVMVYIGP